MRDKVDITITDDEGNSNFIRKTPASGKADIVIGDKTYEINVSLKKTPLPEGSPGYHPDTGLPILHD